MGSAAGNVVPLAKIHERRGDLSWLAGECPGWRCWFSAPAGLWYGRRIVDRWVPDQTGRSYVVTAVDARTLAGLITAQAILDLVHEFPAWRPGCTPAGRWWAVWRGGDPAQPAVWQTSPVRLAALLREQMAAGPASGRAGWSRDRLR